MVANWAKSSVATFNNNSLGYVNAFICLKSKICSNCAKSIIVVHKSKEILHLR